MKYLPCEIEMDDYFDDVMNVVEEYDDKITDFMLSKNTDGDRTKSTNADWFYELMVDKNVVNYCANVINESSHYNDHRNVMYVDKNDLCYKYIRLIYDDGG